MKIKNKIIRKVIYCILFPIIYIWLGLCWCIMKFGHGLYIMGDWMSGYRIDGHNWTEEV